MKFVIKKYFLIFSFLFIIKVSFGQCTSGLLIGPPMTSFPCMCYFSYASITFQPNETKNFRTSTMLYTFTNFSFRTGNLTTSALSTAISPNSVSVSSLVTNVTITNTTASVVTVYFVTQGNYANLNISYWYTNFSGGSACPPGLALPIELTNIEVAQYESSLVLEWQTSSEESFDGFVIEHSLNGISFDSIGFVKGNNSPSSYQWLLTKKETGYLRLKSIDLNGEYSYSQIIKSKSNKNEPLLVFDNTFEETLQITSNSSNDLFIEIQTLQGEIFYRGAIKSGANSLPLSHLPAGIYFLKSELQTVKLMKF